METIKPEALTVGIYLKVGGKTRPLPNAIRATIEKSASERSRMEVVLAYDEVGRFLRDAVELFALATAGGGHIVASLPILGEAGIRANYGPNPTLKVPTGISWGEFLLYSAQAEYPRAITLTAIGPEVFTDTYFGKGAKWEAGTKVEDVLREIAGREDGTKPKWKFLSYGIPGEFKLQNEYSEAGRTPTEVVADLCRSFALVYALEQHKGEIYLKVWGPGALDLPGASYGKEVRPPAWIRITTAMAETSLVTIADSALKGLSWQDLLKGGKRQPEDFLGQAAQAPNLVDGMPLLARLSTWIANATLGEKFGTLKSLIAGVFSGGDFKAAQDNWEEVLQKARQRYLEQDGGVLRLVPLDSPTVRFEPPPKDTLGDDQAQDTSGSVYSYTTVPVAEAIKRLKAAGMKIEEKTEGGKKAYLVQVPGQDTPVRLEEGQKAHLQFQEEGGQKRLVGVLAPGGTTGNGDLANYYPYQMEITVPGAGFLNIWQAVEVRGFGRFLNGWWRILAIRSEWEANQWTCALTLGRKDFPVL